MLLDSSVVSVWPSNQTSEWRVRNWLHAIWLLALFLLGLGIVARRAFVSVFPPSGFAQILLGLLFSVQFVGAQCLAPSTSRVVGCPCTTLARIGTLLLLVSSVTVAGAANWGTAGMWLLVMTASCHDWMMLIVWAREWADRGVAACCRLDMMATPLSSPKPIQTSEQVMEDRESSGNGLCTDDAEGAVRESALSAARERATTDRQSPAKADDETLGTEPAFLSLVANEVGTQIRQQWQRGVDGSGSDFCVGTICVPLAAGQRQSHGHVVVCPPFDGTPEVELEVLDETDAEVDLSQVLPQGWRIDIKVSQGFAQERWIEVGFHARAQVGHRRKLAN